MLSFIHVLERSDLSACEMGLSQLLAAEEAGNYFRKNSFAAGGTWH